MIKLGLECHKTRWTPVLESNYKHLRHINRKNLNFCAMTVRNIMMYIEKGESVGRRNPSTMFKEFRTSILRFT